jgi:hypothetical protein
MPTMAAMMSTAMAPAVPAHVVMPFHGSAAVCVLCGSTFNYQTTQTDRGHQRQSKEKSFHIFAPEELSYYASGE